MPVALCTRVEVVRRWRNQGKVEVVGQWGRKGKVSATYTRGSHESSGDTKLPERNNIININVIRLTQYPGNVDQQFGPPVHFSRSPGNHERLFAPLPHLSTFLLLFCLLRSLLAIAHQNLRREPGQPVAPLSVAPRYTTFTNASLTNQKPLWLNLSVRWRSG